MKQMQSSSKQNAGFSGLLSDFGDRWFAHRPNLNLLNFVFASSLAIAISMALPSVALAAETQYAAANLGDKSLEELLNTPVSIVVGHQEKLSQSAAAVSVITEEDIRRSGATSIPEALRLVPGLDVARVDSHQWAISARGFNDVFANKLLVLQDGRSLYTPLFSGVFWDVQDTLMEDIDHIEVIRGPGAAVWGANAVNGVINIITKNAKDTQGILITGGGGTEERGFGGFRYGGQLGQDVYFRVYAKYFNRDDSAFPNGSDARDAWQMGQGGFRIDWDTLERTQNLLTLQGDIYGGRASQIFNTYDPSNPPSYARTVQQDFRLGGGNLLGRWTHEFSDTSELKLQMYYDRTERNTVIFMENQDTYDLDLKHHFELGERNVVLWGAGYRIVADKIGNSASISLNPDNRRTQLFSAFVQDEITLVEKRLKLTLGAKFEHNDFTGFEFQPSGRLLWTPHDQHTLWASISRAVRTPSRAEEDVKLSNVIPPGGLFPGSPTAVSTIYGNEQFKSEVLIAYELGYRVQPHANLSIDLTTFYNDYDDLRSVEFGPSPTQPLTAPPPPPGLFIPFHGDNKLYGETYGAELAATWQVTKRWRLTPAYTLLEMQLHRQPGSTDTTSEADEGRSPQQQFSLRSSLDLPQGFSVDATLRYVDRLPTLRISSYVELDVRLGWHSKNNNLEVAIVGQNLLAEQHAEFAPSFINTQQTEVQRGVYGKVTMRF
ncbi:MAG: ligand-gated TonB-dependent outer rane channel [Pedosphaera sp.]|nr:ligand-gated TonB-dependent outer rane channel [Pedosphaera sp.]